MIKTPYLLYLGSATDELSIKTSRGLAMFRADGCVGEYRHDDCPLTLGLPRLGFSDAVRAGAKTLVLGVANAGGRMGAELIADAAAAMEAGLDLASGLHSRLKAEPTLVETAQRTGRALHDVRDPRPDLPIGTGLRRSGKRLLTVGTDCSVGKMVTTLCLEQEMRRRGLPTDFRATGQTGILIAGSGVPLDAVIADFISGAIEQLSPDRYDGGWDLIEGQGSLFHPSFAGVSTGLLHGSQPDALVLCHEPNRPHMRGLPHYGLPSIADTLAENLRVARLTNADVQAVGVALNTSKMEERAAKQACDAVSDETNLPCTDPFRFGAAPIVDRLQAVFSEGAHASIA